jgi:hypothetical protein
VTFARRARRLARRVTGAGVRLDRTTTMPPVFVGGTGRSGTTVTARIIGAHPAYDDFPIGVQFIVRTEGLGDLAAGRTSLAAFKQRFDAKWWPRLAEQPSSPVLDRQVADAALRQLQKDLVVDRWAAGRAFAHRMLDPLADAAGKPGWVEMTPGNALRARELLRMFPDARVVHVTRDGRDVACSVVGRGWGPEDLDEALDWWAERYAKAVEAMAALPAGRGLTLALEDLIVRDRAGSLSRLVRFLELDEAPAMREHFDTWVTEERAHLERWRTDVPPERRESFEAHYARLAAGLDGDTMLATTGSTKGSAA